MKIQPVRLGRVNHNSVPMVVSEGDDAIHFREATPGELTGIGDQLTVIATRTPGASCVGRIGRKAVLAGVPHGIGGIGAAGALHGLVYRRVCKRR